MSFFVEMDLACTSELTAAERAMIDPVVYVHLLEICSRVATHCRSHPDPGHTPYPPATQYIRADLALPDDCVWRPDLSFDLVEAVHVEAGEVVVVYRGGRSTVHAPGEHLRVAVAPHKAMTWNEERVFMDESTLRSVAETYGVY